MTSPSTLISNPTAWPVGRGVVRLEWKINIPEWVKIRVERDSGDTEFHEIAALDAAETYLDQKAPTQTLNRTIRYQLRVDGYDQVVGPFKLGVAEADPVALALQEDHLLALEGWGIPSAWFSIKQTSKSCVCYDQILQQSTASNCAQCGGKGIMKSYAMPVIDYVSPVAPVLKKNQVMETGELQRYDRRFWSSGRLPAKPNDVFVLPTAERYRVTAVQPSEIRGFVTRQTLQCVVINPADSEYELPIPEPVMAVLRDPPRRSVGNLG